MERSSKVEVTIIDLAERLVVTALRMLILLLVIAATVVLFIVFLTHLPSKLAEISTAGGILEIMQTAFGGALGVLLGLELSETLKAYFTEHHVRLEVILIVATIAVGRHLIQIDYEHTPATVLAGLGALILSLTVGYMLVKRANAGPETGSATTGGAISES